MNTYRDWSVEALHEHRVAILTELEHRKTVETAAAQAEQLAERYARAIGRTDGDEWVQPTGAHDSYPAGAAVTHDGRTWVSTTPANVWEPGVSGWREQAVTDPGTGEETVPEWRQPTGAHDTYQTGDRVTFGGDTWESVIDNNSWSPRDYPQGWRKI